MRSFAIVTTTPSELRAEVHNRMAMVLGPETWPAAWLGGGGSRRRAPAQGILAPYPSEEMISWPVSSLVAMTRTGSSRSQYNELYAPADAPERRGQGSP